MSQMVNNNLNLWDSSQTNFATSSALAADSQVTDGFQQGDYLKSSIFNGILMELSLVTHSLVDALGSANSSATVTLNVQNDMTPATLSAGIKAILEGLSVNYAATSGTAATATTATNIAGGAAKKLLVQTGAGTTGFVNVGTNGYVLGNDSNGPTWVNPATLTVSHATTAGTATKADAVTTLKNDDTGANATIAFSIGTGANKKSYSKTITVSVPGTVTTASNLAGGIPGNIPYQSGSNTTSFIGVADNSCLLGGGTTPSWQDKSGITVGNANKINNKTFDMSYNSSTHVLTITYHS